MDLHFLITEEFEETIGREFFDPMEIFHHVCFAKAMWKALSEHLNLEFAPGAET